MKTRNIVLFESADELVEAFANRNREHLETDAHIPETVYPVFEEPNQLSLSGDGAENFELAEGITCNDFVSALARACGIAKVHFT